MAVRRGSLNPRSATGPTLAAALLLALSLAAAAPAASAQEPGPSADSVTLPPLGHHVTVIWSDDAELLIAGDDRVAAWNLDGTPRSDAVFVRDAVAAAGAGRGADAVAVVAGAQGELARWRGGAWERDVALVEGEAQVVAAAVAADGTTWIADDRYAVHVWRPGAVPRALPYDDDRDPVVDVVALPGGAQLLHRSGAVTGLALSAAPPTRAEAGSAFPAPRIDAEGGRWVAAWSDVAEAASAEAGAIGAERAPWRLHSSGVLVAPDGELAAVPAQTCTRLDGARVQGQVLLAVGCARAVLLYDGDDFYVVDDGIGIPEALSLAPALGVVFAVDNLGASVRPAGHPLLDADAARPAALPRVSWFGLGVRSGVVLHRYDAGDYRSGWALDVAAGGFLGMSPGRWSFGLWPSVGYSHDAKATNADGQGAPRTGNYFVLGLGPGLSNGTLALAYRAELLAGRAAGEAALGVRHGLWAQAWRGILGLELSHELVYVDAGRLPAFRVLLGIDLSNMVRDFAPRSAWE